jgi:hypothetical protein
LRQSKTKIDIDEFKSGTTDITHIVVALLSFSTQLCRYNVSNKTANQHTPAKIEALN